MNLKNFISKTFATAAAATILWGNTSAFGLGLSRVIAENEAMPDIQVDLQNQVYVQYQEEEQAGVTLVSKLNFNHY